MNRASIKFIFVTILLDAIGIGLLIPVFPDIMRKFTSDPGLVSRNFGYFMSVYALMQFIASPILGTLSDKYGRRLILLISLLGAGLDYLFMAFAPTFFLLFIGRIISGLTGASMTVASSYIADISNDKNRSANFGMIGAAWGLGFILGPVIGGIVSQYGYQIPFLIAAGMNLLNFIYGFFVLPESLSKENRREINLSKLNPFKSILKELKPSSISHLIGIYFILFLAGQVHPSTWTLYTQEKFKWSAYEVGLSLAFVGFMIALAQGGLTRIIVPKWGEEKSLLRGIAIYVIGFFLFGIATKGWMMYLVMVFFSISGIAIPALQSIITKKTPPNEQGELQGTLVSFGSLAAILAPLIYTNIFTFFSKENHYFPGSPYVAASIICTFCYFLYYKWKNQNLGVL